MRTTLTAFTLSLGLSSCAVAQCLPEALTRLGGETTAVAPLSATRVLVASGRTLSIWDVATPSAPFLRGSTELDRDISAVRIVAGHGYVSTRGTIGQLRKFDVSGDFPLPLGMLTSASGLDFDAAGTVIYTASIRADDRVSVSAFDVNFDPPLFLDELVLPVAAANFAAPVLSAGSSRVFVSYETSAGSQVTLIDSRAPADLQVLASRSRTDASTYGRVAMSGIHAYACHRTGLEVLNLPAMTLASSLTNIQPVDAVVSGSSLYLACGMEGIRSYSVSTPGQPLGTGVLSTMGTSSDLAIRSDRLYNADREGGVTTVSIATPSNPATLGTIAAPAPSLVLDMVDVGATLYVLDTLGLRIFSLANPDVPVLQGTCVLPDATVNSCESRSLSIHSGNAYITGCGGRLRVISVANPATPFLRAELSGFPADYDASFSGNFGYFCGLSELRIVDVSNPSSPAVVGSYVHAGACTSVLANGSTLYLGTRDFGLWILDISSPTAPQLVGLRDVALGGFCRGIQRSGSTLYVARTGGFHVLQVSDRTNPIELGWNPDLRASTGRPLALRDGILYLHEMDRGVVRVDIGVPATPVALGGFDGDLGAFAASRGRLYIGDQRRRDMMVVRPQSEWKPEFRRHPADLVPCVGADFELSVDVTANPAASSYRWHKDGVPLSPSARVVGVNLPVLTISQATTGDAGAYTCVASNHCGATTSEAGAVSFCAVDFNCDSFVDFFDYDAFVDCFETGVCPPDRTADFTEDAFVDFFDYDAFVTAFEVGC